MPVDNKPELARLAARIYAIEAQRESPELRDVGKRMYELAQVAPRPVAVLELRDGARAGSFIAGVSLQDHAYSLPAGNHEVYAVPPPGPEIQLPSLDEELAWILGSPSYAVAAIASLLHDLGHYCCRGKAEKEQAAVIHWMTNLYLRHGARWREVAVQTLEGQPTEWLKNRTNDR